MPKPRKMLQTWRWYGPRDQVTLQNARQAGAQAIVSSLHELPIGAVWPVEKIQERQAIIEKAGLAWEVVESVPVHESIKTRAQGFLEHVENYKQSLRNLGNCGIETVCYNFMPVLDWTRTEVEHLLPNGAKTLRYERAAFIAFDLFTLEREGAEASYTEKEISQARTWQQTASQESKDRVSSAMCMGLPGRNEPISLPDFRAALNRYQGIGEAELQSNLLHFLAEIAPVAEEVGIKLTIHPDDPPFPLLGLPRILSTAAHFRRLAESVPSPANGLCFCTGSFGVRTDNDLVAMAEEFADRIHFVHLRATSRDEAGNFYEAEHLTGDVDMYRVMKVLLQEQQRRDKAIPFRPDHGHQLLDDLGKESHPGYPAIGRLKGLAELRGLEEAIVRELTE